MECEACGSALPAGAVTCPQCGASVGGDGGTGADDQASDGEPTTVGSQVGDDAATDAGGDQVANPAGGNGENADRSGGQAAASGAAGAASSGGPNQGASPSGTGGQPGGPNPAAGQPGGPGQPGGRGGSTGGLKKQAAELPLRLAAALGAAALLIPYSLAAIASFVVADEKPLDLAAAVFFRIVEFGPSEEIVDMFVAAKSGWSGVRELNPSNHPDFQQELAGLQEILLETPDVPFLLLFLVFPYVVFLSGRYLARHYTDEDTLVEHAKVGASVAVGTVAVILAIGVAFDAPDLGNKVIATGLLLPGALGAIGGVSVFVWDDYSALGSSSYGWLASAVGIAVAYVLLKTPGDAMGGQMPDEFGFTAVEKLLFAMNAWLASLELQSGMTDAATLTVFLVLLAIVAAGFLFTWRSRDEIADGQEGARAGSSILLGLLGPVAFVGWFSQIGMIFVSLGFGISLPTVTAGIQSFDDYTNVLLVGGVIVPAVLGAAGGYLAIWYRDRDAAQPAPQGQTQPQGQSGPQSPPQSQAQPASDTQSGGPPQNSG